jgi:hypothetical protein
MSEAMNPLDTDGAASGARAASAAGQAAAPPATGVARRPGLVTFSAIMLFLAAGFSVVWAILEFSGAPWVRNAYNAYGYTNFSSYLWLWGFLDLIVAAIAIYAGVDVLRGGPFGLIIGLCIAGFSALRWFFYLPVAPWLAVTVIAIDVLVIYGLVTNADYFDSRRLQ